MYIKAGRSCVIKWCIEILVRAIAHVTGRVDYLAKKIIGFRVIMIVDRLIEYLFD